MIILTLRTDKPEAELALFDDDTVLEQKNWLAHRQLAETLHAVIKETLHKQGKDWVDVQGIVVYKGPGSFTGLRIGLSVANALAYGVGASIVGQTSDDWQKDGIAQLLAGQNQKQVLPEYGANVHITQQKK